MQGPPSQFAQCLRGLGRVLLCSVAQGLHADGQNGWRRQRLHAKDGGGLRQPIGPVAQGLLRLFGARSGPKARHIIEQFEQQRLSLRLQRCTSFLPFCLGFIACVGLDFQHGLQLLLQRRQGRGFVIPLPQLRRIDLR